MTKLRIIFMSDLCSLMAFLAAQALSPAQGSDGRAIITSGERQRNMTEAERKKEAAKKAKQLELELTQKMRELAKEGRGPLIDRKQKQKEYEEKAAEIRKNFLREKAALGVTEEQWKLIKLKLEKVRLLRGQANSAVGLFLAGGSSDNETNLKTRARTKASTWQWKQPWKDKDPSELTNAQKIAVELIKIVEKKNTTPEQFRRKMDALQMARREEDQIKRQLSEPQKELRELLTTRQEAALVLMNSF